MKRTILVVDDFDSIRQFVCESLQRKGYDTISASNGNEAYQLMVDQKIDLVLSDYNMPGCTGFELLKKIKLTPTISSVPVIFLTTETNPEKMRAAKEVGLSAWIKKPYRADSFYAQIENAIISRSDVA